MAMGTAMNGKQKLVALVIHGAVILFSLTSATILAVTGHLAGDALIGLYGAAIGSAGASAATRLYSLTSDNIQSPPV